MATDRARMLSAKAATPGFTADVGGGLEEVEIGVGDDLYCKAAAVAVWCSSSTSPGIVGAPTALGL